MWMVIGKAKPPELEKGLFYFFNQDFLEERPPELCSLVISDSLQVGEFQTETATLLKILGATHGQLSRR